MTDTNTEERVITRGDNQPPEGLLPILPPTEADEEARAEALARAQGAQTEDEAPAFDLNAFADLEALTLTFCDAAGAWQRIKTIATAAQSERLTDFVTGARQLYKRVDDQRKGDKAPWDAGGKKVQDAYSPLLTKLDTIGKVMKGMQADWLRREEQRLAEEKRVAVAEAAKAKEEAEHQLAQAAARGDISAQIDAEAALKDAEKAQKTAAKPVKARAGTATGAGRTMSLRKQRVAEITNPRACFAAFRDEPAVVEALLRCANEAIRAGFTDEQALIAGFKIIEKDAAA